MKVLINLLSLVMLTSASYADTQVSSNKLRDLLDRCSSAQDDQAEVKCLRRGIMRTIRGNDNESSALQCRGNGSNFAIFNSKTGQFVDLYYSKSASECARAIDEATDKYVCVTKTAGGAAIYDYSQSKFVDNYYGGNLDSCIRAVRGIRRNVVCLVNGSSQYARYDLERKEFLDNRYSLSIDECLALSRH